jgi:hypothetical protein
MSIVERVSPDVNTTEGYNIITVKNGAACSVAAQ